MKNLTTVLQQKQRVVDQLVDGRLGNHTNDAAHGITSCSQNQKIRSGGEGHIFKPSGHQAVSGR